MIVSEKQVSSDYMFLKKNAQKLFAKGNIEETIENIRLACTLAKIYYLTYMDDELEDLCEKIADVFAEKHQVASLLQTIDRTSQVPILFYDYFGLDRIDLTQQYLRALGKRSEGLVYLIPHSIDENKSKFIIRDIESQKNTKLVTLKSENSHTKMIDAIIDAVIESKSRICFAQLATDDIDGIIAFYALKGLSRYYIEAVDHTIWLGVRRFDYYINFRAFGYRVALEERKIPASKLIIQPYYPIIDSNDFEGLPETGEGKIKIFSGGRLFKSYSKDAKFFHIIRKILQDNQNAVFYYAGGGNVTETGQAAHLKKLIAQYGLQERYILLGYRKDIFALMSEMDIYIGTWPMPGGLMSQIAAVAKVPIVQYSKNGMGKSVLDFLNINSPDIKVVFEDEEKLYSYVHFLINNEDERKRIGREMSKGIIKESTFEKDVLEMIDDPKNKRDTAYERIDISEWHKFAFEKENMCEHQYYAIYANSYVFRKQKPFTYMINVAKLILSSDKEWLIKKLKKKLYKGTGK